jgi:hypothetical protein
MDPEISTAQEYARDGDIRDVDHADEDDEEEECRVCRGPAEEG